MAMPPRARSAWFRTLGQLALILAAAAVAGWLIGYPWPVITGAALGVVAWHYWRLHDVLTRLTARQRMTPPLGENPDIRVLMTLLALNHRDWPDPDDRPPVAAVISSAANVRAARLALTPSGHRFPLSPGRTTGFRVRRSDRRS